MAERQRNNKPSKRRSGDDKRQTIRRPSMLDQPARQYDDQDYGAYGVPGEVSPLDPAYSNSTFPDYDSGDYDTDLSDYYDL